MLSEFGCIRLRKVVFYADLSNAQLETCLTWPPCPTELAYLVQWHKCLTPRELRLVRIGQRSIKRTVRVQSFLQLLPTESDNAPSRRVIPINRRILIPLLK